MIVPAGCILGTIPFAAALGLVLMAMQAARNGDPTFVAAAVYRRAPSL